MSVNTLHREQELRATQEEIRDFISGSSNLAFSTPPTMGFVIGNDDLPRRIHAGMMSSYWRFSPMSIRTNRLTEISHVEESNNAMEEQRQGEFIGNNLIVLSLWLCSWISSDLFHSLVWRG